MHYSKLEVSSLTKKKKKKKTNIQSFKAIQKFEIEITLLLQLQHYYKTEKMSLKDTVHLYIC